MEAYGLQDIRTATALHNLAGEKLLFTVHLSQQQVMLQDFTRLCERGDMTWNAKEIILSAGLHMARKDAQAASQTMQRAIEAKRLALGPTHPAVAESVLGLAAIHRASGCPTDAIELLQKETNFLMKEEKASSPGIPHCASREECRSSLTERCSSLV